MTRLDDDKFEYKKEQEVPQSISELNHTSEMVRLLEINASPGRKIQNFRYGFVVVIDIVVLLTFRQTFQNNNWKKTLIYSILVRFIMPLRYVLSTKTEEKKPKLQQNNRMDG